MNTVIKFFAFISLFFYVMCWFTDQPTETLYYIGISLPWLSLILSILVGFICDIKNEKYFAAWGYIYAITTIIYVIVVSIMSGSIWHQLPHLAACACFIAYFTIEQQYKQNKS